MYTVRQVSLCVISYKDICLKISVCEVTSFSVALHEQTKILFGQLNCSVKLADISTRCSSHSQDARTVKLSEKNLRLFISVCVSCHITILWEMVHHITMQVFLDEVNTSSCVGLFKEIIVDKTLDGDVRYQYFELLFNGLYSLYVPYLVTFTSN